MSKDVYIFVRTRPARQSSPPVLWAPHGDGFERAIVFEPGFGMDPAERSKPASQQYGRHSMQMRWLLRGPRGVAQFLMSTGWTPEPAPADPRWPTALDWMTTSPSAGDLGYHARVPQYEGAEQYGEQPCLYLAASCWYDGSGLAADPVLADFFDRGEVAVWEALREVHDELLTVVEVGS
jgi:hypothetical protein